MTFYYNLEIYNHYSSNYSIIALWVFASITRQKSMCYYCVVVAVNCMENSDSIFRHADPGTSSLGYDLLLNYLSLAMWDFFYRKPPFNYGSTVKGGGRKGWGVEV